MDVIIEISFNKFINRIKIIPHFRKISTNFHGLSLIIALAVNNQAVSFWFSWALI